MEKFIIDLGPHEVLVKDLIEPLLESEGYELVDIKMSSSFSRPVLSIYVDKNDDESDKILLKDLTNVSQFIGDVLDMNIAENSFFTERYELEVSSPGLDRPLTKISHFQKCLGHKVKIKLRKANENGTKNLSGKLILITEQGLNIESEDGQKNITVVDFNEIAQSNRIFVFEEKKGPKNRKSK
jgi:ribosome maturation factor RimP